MSRRVRVVIAAVAVLAVAGSLSWWATRGSAVPVPTVAPVGTPRVGSCWDVTGDTARLALPWPGDPVSCQGTFTAEVYHVGQVNHELIKKEWKAKGDDKKVADNLMYAEVRRACGTFATRYLGRDWHTAQVTVLANWIKPARDGFFACAVAQVADPGGTRLVSRTGSLHGLFAGDGVTPLDVSCVSRGTGGALSFARCDQAHDGEFVGTYVVTSNTVPFDAAALAQTVNQGCAGAILSYLGLSAGETRNDLSVGYVGPTTASTWLGSDQTFACYAMAQVRLRGSIHNLGTRPLPR